MKRGQLYLFFRPLLATHLGKDLFIVPKLLGRALNYDVSIVHPQTLLNRDLPSQIDGVDLRAIPTRHPVARPRRIVSDMKLLCEIVKRAREVDVMVLFHFRRLAKLGAFVYKFLNPNGLVYIKLDVSGQVLQRKRLKDRGGFVSRLKSLSYWVALRSVDVASCETQLAYDVLRETKFASPSCRSKLLLMENGFDEELLRSLDIQERNFSQKDKIFITVGRLGIEQKNTQLLLRTLRMVELEDWKFYLIGSIEPSLQSEIDRLFDELPHLRERVIFTGMISEKRELWRYYNRAKVFVLSSLHESSGLVFYEAKRFRNYIISTNVGAFDDVTEGGRYGREYAQDDDAELAQRLSEVISGQINIDVYDESFDPESLSWMSRVSVVADRLRDLQ